MAGDLWLINKAEKLRLSSGLLSDWLGTSQRKETEKQEYEGSSSLQLALYSFVLQLAKFI
jgi:butyrate kinase